MSNEPDQVSLEIVENDIPFNQILTLIRGSDRKSASDLLHGALKVAFNNGERFGMNNMAKIAHDAIATHTSGKLGT